MNKPRKEKCNTCPFNEGYNEEATKAQNYGCLPTAFDILNAKDIYCENWMCHSNENLVCAGLAENRNVETGKSIRYSKWYLGQEGNHG